MTIETAALPMGCTLIHAYTERFRMSRIAVKTKTGFEYSADFLDDDFAGEGETSRAVQALFESITKTTEQNNIDSGRFTIVYCGAQSLFEVERIVCEAIRNVVTSDDSTAASHSNTGDCPGGVQYMFSHDTSFAVRILLPEVLCFPQTEYELDLVEGCFRTRVSIDTNVIISDKEITDAAGRVLIKNTEVFDSPKAADFLLKLSSLKFMIEPIDLITLVESVTSEEIMSAASRLRVNESVAE